MLLYLANSTQLDISFMVNQCARFSNDPTEPHATALKWIGCYLKSTEKKGIILRKCAGIPQLNCWVDANFAGLYSKEDPHNPTSARSRTGFIIALGENPVVWQSKLQSEIALSTMLAEYIALSTAMRSLIHLCNVHHEVCHSRGGQGTAIALDCRKFNFNGLQGQSGVSHPGYHRATETYAPIPYDHGQVPLVSRTAGKRHDSSG